MGRTQKDYKNIEDQGIRKRNMNISVPGESVLVQAQAGPGIKLDSTGADTGTGVVTFSVLGTPSTIDELVKVTATDASSNFLFDKFTDGINSTIVKVSDPIGNEQLKINVTPRVFQQIFSREDDVEDGKWLRINEISTDKVPYILPYDTKSLLLTLSNKENNTGTIRIFVNDVFLLDISLNNTKTQKINTNTVLSANDKISAKCISGFLEDVHLFLLFSIT